MNRVSTGNEWAQLKQAYEYWESLKDGRLKDSAYLAIMALLIVYNDNCSDWEDEIHQSELLYLFGDE